jgi:hypothetical protein
VERFADGARQMNIRRLDDERILPLFHSHDAIERVLDLGFALQVPRQVQDFSPVLYRERAGDGDPPGGVFVACPVTGRADLLVRSGRSLPLLPASVVVHGGAGRADGGLGELPLRRVGIVHELPEPAVLPARPR